MLTFFWMFSPFLCSSLPFSKLRCWKVDGYMASCFSPCYCVAFEASPGCAVCFQQSLLYPGFCRSTGIAGIPPFAFVCASRAPAPVPFRQEKGLKQFRCLKIEAYVAWVSTRSLWYVELTLIGIAARCARQSEGRCQPWILDFNPGTALRRHLCPAGRLWRRESRWDMRATHPVGLSPANGGPPGCSHWHPVPCGQVGFPRSHGERWPCGEC